MQDWPLLIDQPEPAAHAFLGGMRFMDNRDEYGVFSFPALNGLAAVAATQRRDRDAAMLSEVPRTPPRPSGPCGIARHMSERFFAPARAGLGDRRWQAHMTPAQGSIAIRRSRLSAKPCTAEVSPRAPPEQSPASVNRRAVEIQTPDARAQRTRPVTLGA